jgi:2-methylisocitrate lyase-like PEP mutase family enzyme
VPWPIRSGGYRLMPPRARTWSTRPACATSEVREVVRAVNRPVNVVTGWLDRDITLAQLSEAGAKRISVGGALSRLVLASFVEAARAMRDQGSFAWMRDMMGMAEARKLLESQGS